MSSLTAWPREWRRLVAVLLTLGVVLTSAGWAHPACAAVADASDAAAMASLHVGMSGVQAVDRPATDHDAGRSAGGGHCSDHGRHPVPDAGSCATMAHCGAADAPTAAVIQAPDLRASTPPTMPAAGRLLERAERPEAPPPRS